MAYDGYYRMSYGNGGITIDMKRFFMCGDRSKISKLLATIEKDGGSGDMKRFIDCLKEAERECLKDLNELKASREKAENIFSSYSEFRVNIAPLGRERDIFRLVSKYENIEEKARKKLAKMELDGR